MCHVLYHTVGYLVLSVLNLNRTYSGQKPAMPVASGIKATMLTTVLAVPCRACIPIAARIMPSRNPNHTIHHTHIVSEHLALLAPCNFHSGVTQLG